MRESDHHRPLEPAGTAAAVLERLAVREKARAAEREQRQQAAEAAADPGEDVAAFLAGFAADHAVLRGRCAALEEAAAAPAAAPGASAPEGEDTKKQALLARAEGVAAELGRLEQAVADAAYFLPPYEQRSCSGQLAALRAQLAAAKQSLQPRQRFKFSKPVARKAAAAAADGASPAAGVGAGAGAAGAAAATAAAAAGPPGHGGGSAAPMPTDTRLADQGAPAPAEPRPPPPSAHDLQLIAAGRGCAGLRGQVVVRRAAELAGDAFVLHDLADCSVFLLGPLGALRLQHLRRCRVFTGPVAGATFVSGAADCLLMIASQQVRIHDALRCRLYLRVRSRPVIEHSSALAFAPYAVERLLLRGAGGGGGGGEVPRQQLEGEQQQQQQQEPQQQEPQRSWHELLERAQLSGDLGLWCQVDDFGWVKASQSPHWGVLPEAEREPVPEALPAAGPQPEERLQAGGRPAGS